MSQEFPSFENSQGWKSVDDAPRESGVYAVFLKSVDNLPDDWKERLNRNDRLFHIGMGKSGLRKRLKKHFAKYDSTKDTFRRSAGAILREHLELMPCMRPAASNKWQYSFQNEEKLTSWIQQNCKFAFQEFPESKVESEEKTLIKHYCPPLNDKNNPRRLQSLKEVRDDCVNIANAK